jgi:SAM-dependent methyltransferase
MSSARHCCICRLDATPADEVHVGSNVRPLADTDYALWRCAGCGSIHARDKVDLEAAYAVYPFFRQKMDWTLRSYCRGLLQRLRRIGTTPNHTILDYGCGSGLLVGFLQRKGYRAVGYDPYSSTHNDPAVLETQFDLVLAQDVVEHDPDPLDALSRIAELARPGGQVVIGTPNASGIDLSRPRQFRHPLHQPYHRHIFSVEALRESCRALGLIERRYWPTPYTNIPGLSLPMLHHYMDHYDGTLDVLFDRPDSAGLWRDPKTWWLLAAGYFLCDDADIMLACRKA